MYSSGQIYYPLLGAVLDGSISVEEAKDKTRVMWDSLKNGGEL
jgi:hypothetical protein